MEHFSINQVRLGNGAPAAQYIVCVTDEAVTRDMESSSSEVKKYLPKHAEDDKHFKAKAAAILGGRVCGFDCSQRFNHWVSAGVPEATVLPCEPSNLGEPTLSASASQHSGVRIWLLKAEISRLPNYF